VPGPLPLLRARPRATRRRPAALAAPQIADELVRSGAVDLVVLDSVAALVPRAELEGDMGALQVGRQGPGPWDELMSQEMG
jgi:RecA/RadA recombinase